MTTSARTAPSRCRRSSSATPRSSRSSASSSRCAATTCRRARSPTRHRAGRPVRQRPAGHPRDERHGALLAQPRRRPFDLPREMRERPGGLRLGDPGVAADRRRRRRPRRPAGHQPAPLPATIRCSFERPLGRALVPALSRRRRASTSRIPRCRLVDLDGDGVTDAIRSGTRLECFFNDPERGLERDARGRAQRARRASRTSASPTRASAGPT